MSNRLLNIRLTGGDARRADGLRRQGVNISEFVRQAIRKEHELHHQRRPKHQSAEELMAALEAIYKKYPIPQDEPYEPIDLSDRHAVAERIRRNWERKRQRSGEA